MRDEFGQFGRLDVPCQTEMHDTGLQKVPGLGLAVRPAEVRLRESPVRVRVHREPLSRIQQLDQQHRVRTEPGDVRRAQPAHRIRDNRVAQPNAIREHGQADRGISRQSRRRPDPILRHPVAGGRKAPELGNPRTAPVEAIGGLIGPDDQRLDHADASIPGIAAARDMNRRTLSSTMTSLGRSGRVKYSPSSAVMRLSAT